MASIEESLRGTDIQALTSVLVEKVQCRKHPTIVSTMMDEVVGPEVVGR